MVKLMSRRLVALAAVCSLTLASAAYAQDADKAALLRKHFETAIKAFQNDQYDDAAKEFEEVLKLSPNSNDALELRDLAEVQFYIRAMEKGSPSMRANVFKLLELAAQAEKARLTDSDRIDKLIQDLSGTGEERAYIYIELAGAGRHAVVPLLKRLQDTQAIDYADYHVWATLALIRIGEEAVPPLCTALRSASVPVRQDICFILGQIGDPRAAPYLLHAAKNDPEEAVQGTAQDAIAKIREYADVPDVPPQVALFNYAKLYYYDDPSIRRTSRYGHAIWNWLENEDRPTMEVVPDFLYDVSMAKHVATEALLAAPDYEPTLPLLISAYRKEILLIERRLEASATDPSRALSEREERDLHVRLAKDRNVLLTLRSAGEKHFYRALGLQLRDRDPQLAEAVIVDLALVASPELNTYPALPDLEAPVQPAVITVVQPRPRAMPPASKSATPAAADEPAARTKTVVDATQIFARKVEEEATRVARPGVRKEVAPAERETLNYLIAAARRRAAARKEADAAEQQAANVVTVAPLPSLQSNPLVLALQSTDKGVRYGAAAALVRIAPTDDFASARNVVEILGQAISEKGVSTVLIVTPNSQAANRLREIARAAGHIPYAAASTDAAMAAARALPPKDLVIIQDTMMGTFVELRKDPLIATIPFVVFTAEADASGTRRAFADKVAGVISLAGSVAQARDTMTAAVLGSRTAREGEALALRHAHTAAAAIYSISQGTSPFSRHLERIKDPLISALDSDDISVRVTAAAALGKAKITAMLPRLVDICADASRPRPERLACLMAVGDMIKSADEIPPSVVGLVKQIHENGDLEFRLVVADFLGRAALPPAELEKIITLQEASEPPPEAPMPAEGPGAAPEMRPEPVPGLELEVEAPAEESAEDEFDREWQDDDANGSVEEEPAAVPDDEWEPSLEEDSELTPDDEWEPAPEDDSEPAPEEDDLEDFEF